MDASTLLAITRTSLFSCLAAEDARRLAAGSRRMRFQPGEALFRCGDAAEHLHVVASGAVALTEGADGVPCGMVHAVDAVGEEAVLARGRHALAAHAASAVLTLALPAGPILDQLDARPELMLALLAGASLRLRGTVHEITEMKLRSTTRRLAGYLCQLAEARPGVRRLVLPCEKRQLAERLGMQPESLSRAFSKLRPLGVATGRDEHVTIADLDALRRFWREPEPGLTD